MKPSRISQALINGLLWVAALCAAPAFAQSYQVTIDTSAIAGETGYVDFQFNRADLFAPEAGASVLSWTGNISLLGAPIVEGSVTGALPGTLTLGNDTAFNDYFQAVEFGDMFSVIVQFSGDAPPASLIGTSFALSLYAADAATPLLSDDVSGSIVRFELLGGDTTVETFSSFAQVTPVPLPAAAWLLLSGVVGLVRVSRVRRV